MDESQQVGQALVAALRRDVGQELALRSMPQRLSGGFWASIWEVEFEHAPAPFTGRLVLRIMPDANACDREVAVQSWLAEAGYPTPRVFASGHAEGLGEAYAVMQHAAGRSPLGGLKLGRAILGIRRILTDMPKLLAQTAADLHALDPQPLGEVLNETNSAAPSGLKDHAYVSFRAGIENAAAQTPTSQFDVLAQWLDTHRPVPSGEVICHGDLHPFNLLVDDHDAVTVLDWTTASLAPREMDLGLTAGLLRCAPIGAPRLIRPVLSRITNHLADSFIDNYKQTANSNLDVDDDAVTWWEVLQHGRCLAALADGRLHPGSIVGPNHPFEASHASMRDRVRTLTGITITVPDRRSPTR